MTWAYPTNVTNLTSWFTWGNSVTQSWFSTAIIFIVFVVAFLGMKAGYPTHKAYVSATFIAFLMTLFFYVIGLTGLIVLIISIVMLVTGIAWLWFADKQEY